MRKDGRVPDALRPIKVTRGFTQTAAASILWEQGRTIVWCTASISTEPPPWFRDDRPGEWITLRSQQIMAVQRQALEDGR